MVTVFAMSRLPQPPAADLALWSSLEPEIKQGLRWGMGILTVDFPDESVFEEMRRMGLFREEMISRRGQDVFRAGSFLGETQS